jgi:hypothetical protein
LKEPKNAQIQKPSLTCAVPRKGAEKHKNPEYEKIRIRLHFLKESKLSQEFYNFIFIFLSACSKNPTQPF